MVEKEGAADREGEATEREREKLTEGGERLKRMRQN